MKRSIKLFVALLVCGLLNQFALYASSHREAPLISNDPLADNTDVYAFRSPGDSSKVVLIANYIPFEHPAGGPNWYNFGSNIRYEIHVKNDATTMGDDITYRFTFQSTNQDPTTFFNIRLGAQNIKTTYTLEKGIAGVFTTIITNGVVPPNNIGPRSIENPALGLNVPNYDTLMNRAITMASGPGAAGEKVFAGPIDDPFFVDLGGAFDVGGFRKTGRDGLAKMNCHSLVIEVPISSLQKSHLGTASATSILDPNFVIGVYASASRPSISTFDSTGAAAAVGGTWTQVSRLGMPLTNEAVIPIGMKDKWNATATNSSDELSFAGNFTNPELALYMDDSQFGGAVPGLKDLRIQTNSLGGFDFRNGKKGLYTLKGNPALVGTAFDPATFGNILLPDDHSPRAADLLPIFYTGVPNLVPYQLATGKTAGPLSAGKPFINNFLPTLGDMLRLNMAVPVTPRNSPDFNSLGLVYAAVLGLTDTRFTASGTALQNIPNMDGFPNGRRLEDDVTTIELQAVSGVVLAAVGLWYDDYVAGGSPVTPQLLKVLGFNAGVTKNDTTLKAVFPYVQGPWRGFTGASYVGPVNAVTTLTPVAFTTCPKTNLVIARPGYNTYNGEGVMMYNLDTTTGAATMIPGGPLKDPFTGKNFDMNGAGINSDGFVYGIRDTTNTAGTAKVDLLYRIGSTYANYPVGTLPTPTLTGSDNLAYVNPAAGTFDDNGNYYYTAVTGIYSFTNKTFTASKFYLGKIANVAALTQSTAALTPTWTPIDFSGANCAGFLSNLTATYSSITGAGAGTGFEDITYSNLHRSIYMFEAFKSTTTGLYVDQLFGINPTTGVATCYTSTSGVGATNNEVSGISTTANGGLRVFFTGGDIYKIDLGATDYTSTLTKLGASGVTPLGVTGSIRGDLASCGFGSTSLPATISPTLITGGVAILTDGIIAYPNPVRGLTTVSVLQSLNNATVRLMGISGNVVSTQSGVTGTTFRVDLTNKPSGLYIVEILQGGNIQKLKILKQ